MRKILTTALLALTFGANAQTLNPDNYEYPVRNVAGLCSSNFGEMRPDHFHSGVDIKTDGITREIMQQALTDAHAARIHLLSIMAKALPEPRTELSPYAPRMATMNVSPDKVKDIIGKGGANIRMLQTTTNTSIDINDEGVVRISAPTQAAAEDAMKRINDMLVDVEVGRDYDGKVVRITDFGAFINILPGRDGLVHISQIADERVESVGDYLRVGDQVRVRVLDVDNTGRIRLSIKALAAERMARMAQENAADEESAE